LELLNNKETILPRLKEAGIKASHYKSPYMNKMLLLSISLPKYSSEDVERKVFKNIIENFKKQLVDIL